MALPEVVSSLMNTLHSVVLRCAFQHRFGYESGAYSGTVSSGIIWAFDAAVHMSRVMITCGESMIVPRSSGCSSE